jgi:hypothetical protein
MPKREPSQLENALKDFFESQQQADADFVGEQREWHLPRLNRAAKNFMLLFPIESAEALGRVKSPYDEE